MPRKALPVHRIHGIEMIRAHLKTGYTIFSVQNKNRTFHTTESALQHDAYTFLFFTVGYSVRMMSRTSHNLIHTNLDKYFTLHATKCTIRIVSIASGSPTERFVLPNMNYNVHFCLPKWTTGHSRCTFASILLCSNELNHDFINLNKNSTLKKMYPTLHYLYISVGNSTIS